MVTSDMIELLRILIVFWSSLKITGEFFRQNATEEESCLRQVVRRGLIMNNYIHLVSNLSS